MATGKLSAVALRNPKPGKLNDGDGLMLIVGAKGQASWMLRYQFAGKRRDIGLGSLRDVTLAEARDKRDLVRKQAMAGLDPVVERKRVAVVVPTFEEAARTVHEERTAGWDNAKHQKQWLATLVTYAFPTIGKLRLDKVEHGHVRDLLAAIWLTKPETARRVRQRVAAVLDWGHAKGFRASETPLRSINRGLGRQPKNDGHFAALPYGEVPALIEAMRSKTDTFGRLALEALIFTAARSGEIRGATWAEVDLDAATWTVPAARMKMGKVHVVPLSPPAVATFKRAKAMRTEGSDLVFPGRLLKKPQSDMTLLKILRDMNVNGTVHGMRSAFRDWVAEETEIAGEVAEAALAHALPSKVEAAYKRTDFLAKRRKLMDAWGSFCVGSHVSVVKLASVAA